MKVWFVPKIYVGEALGVSAQCSRLSVCRLCNTVKEPSSARTEAGSVNIVNLCSSKGKLAIAGDYIWQVFDFLFSIFGLYFLFSYADLGTVSVCLSVSHTLCPSLLSMW